jgi:hypothetical protein
LPSFQGQVTLIISDVVQEEARRNLHAKAPQALPFLEQVLGIVPFAIVAPGKQEVLVACAYTELKDAPIVGDRAK